MSRKCILRHALVKHIALLVHIPHRPAHYLSGVSAKFGRKGSKQRTSEHATTAQLVSVLLKVLVLFFALYYSARAKKSVCTCEILQGSGKVIQFP